MDVAVGVAVADGVTVGVELGMGGWVGNGVAVGATVRVGTGLTCAHETVSAANANKTTTKMMRVLIVADSNPAARVGQSC